MQTGGRLEEFAESAYASGMNSSNDVIDDHPEAVSVNIELRGVRVHNLKSIDVDIPLNQLTVITGVSGSGKSSLAFDTLYAEGQRRYIESFSTAARRHLERLEKPDADSIVRIPPAVALRQNSAAYSVSRRSTIATVTEIDDLLRVLFSRVGSVVCPDCDIPVVQDSARTVAKWVAEQSDGRKLQIGFPLRQQAGDATEVAGLLEAGFTRAVMIVEAAGTALSGQTVTIQNDVLATDDTTTRPIAEIVIIVDRVVAGKTSNERLVEAVETAMREAGGRCVILAQAPVAGEESTDERTSNDLRSRSFDVVPIDGNDWHLLRFSSNFDCSFCGRLFIKPEPATLSFRSPLGACSTCRGTGTVSTLSFEKLVPDESLSLQTDAVVALVDDRWKRERERLLQFAENAGIPIDLPMRELTVKQRALFVSGGDQTETSSNRTSEGLAGLFERLERRKQHSSVREFLNRWRQIDTCETCQGTRLRPEALAVRISQANGQLKTSQPVSISDVSAMTVDEALRFLQNAAGTLSEERSIVGAHVIANVVDRLKFLESAGLGYLRLNRGMASLSRGEAQRVAMTSIAGSNLVNTLFVIDEPSAGLHPRDVTQVVRLVQSLRDRCNTVVVVEHELAFLNAADHVIDIGPAAGQQGGELVFAGNAGDLSMVENSATGQWLAEMSPAEQDGSSSTSSNAAVQKQRSPTGWLHLRGANCHTVQDCSVDIPLGCLCVVTGVSGAGKSSLIENVLFPAICEKLGQSCAIDHVGEYQGLAGIDQVSSVELIDDRPLAGTRRSNPATWLKVFDEIRRLFADTEDARNRNLTASHFSFNTDSGGRCNKCEGTGRVEIDMQFLADVSMTCPDCNGTRYLPHILEVQWRARTIADVLAMTASEAFSFFRGQAKIQKRLRSLKDVGLDYLTLGQPLSTLSGGESQRLKLAACLAASSRTSSLLIMNEPTTGLHPADVARLLECFDGLLSVGHSLVVIEHHLNVIHQADHIIDMGPEAGPAGGRIVATGSLAEVAACPESITGQYLRETMRPE